MLSTNIQLSTMSHVLAVSSTLNHNFLPVKASQFIYSQFEHVSGVPSNEGGVSVSKLQILNSLIDTIIKKNTDAKLDQSKLANLSDGEMDKILASFHSKLQAQNLIADEVPYIQKSMGFATLFNVEA